MTLHQHQHPLSTAYQQSAGGFKYREDHSKCEFEGRFERALQFGAGLKQLLAVLLGDILGSISSGGVDALGKFDETCDAHRVSSEASNFFLSKYSEMAFVQEEENPKDKSR